MRVGIYPFKKASNRNHKFYQFKNNKTDFWNNFNKRDSYSPIF